MDQSSKDMTEAIGNLAMRYHQIELDVRDQADAQTAQKYKLSNIKGLLYADIFLTAMAITLIVMK
nr:MAG TPA: hypothetical protein [Caudoviricetes sp.]